MTTSVRQIKRPFTQPDSLSSEYEFLNLMVMKGLVWHGCQLKIDIGAKVSQGQSFAIMGNLRIRV